MSAVSAGLFSTVFFRERSLPGRVLLCAGCIGGASARGGEVCLSGTVCYTAGQLGAAERWRLSSDALCHLRVSSVSSDPPLRAVTPPEASAAAGARSVLAVYTAAGRAAVGAGGGRSSSAAPASGPVYSGELPQPPALQKLARSATAPFGQTGRRLNGVTDKRAN